MARWHTDPAHYAAQLINLVVARRGRAPAGGGLQAEVATKAQKGGKPPLTLLITAL